MQSTGNNIDMRRPQPYDQRAADEFTGEGFAEDSFNGDGFDGYGRDRTGRQGARAYIAELPLGKDPASIRKRIEGMERLLENSFVIPGINRPVGLDALVGLIPVVGDFTAAAMGAYIVWEGRNLGMPKWKLLRMTGNLAFDTVIGAVPFAGDVFDFMFRSNTRNLRIIRKHLDKHHPETQVIDQ